MSYANAIDEMNKVLELYMKNKCDPGVHHLSKAMQQLTTAIEQDLKDQSKQLRKIRALLEDRK